MLFYQPTVFSQPARALSGAVLKDLTIKPLTGTIIVDFATTAIIYMELRSNRPHSSM